MSSRPKGKIALDQVFNHYRGNLGMLGLLVLASVFTNFVVSFDLNLYFFSSPYIISTISVPEIYLGISASSFTLGVIIFATIGGYLFSKYSVKKLILLSIAVITVFSVLTGYVQNVAELIAARFLFGVGNGLIQGIITSLLGGLYPKKKGLLLSLKGITFSAGLLFGPYTEAFFAPAFRVPFLATGAVGIVCLALILLYLPDIYMPGKPGQGISMKRLFNRNTTMIFLSIFFFGIGLFGLLGYFSHYMLMELHYSNGSAAIISSMLGVGGLILTIPMGHLSDIWNRKLTMAIMFVILAVSSFAIFGIHPGYLAVAVFSTLFGGGYNSLINIVSAAAQEFGDSRDLGQLSGMAFSFYYGGGIIGGPLFGLLIPAIGYHSAGVITVSLFMVVGLACTLAISEGRRQSSSLAGS